MGILPEPIEKWQIKQIDELNYDELDNFYCSCNFTSVFGNLDDDASTLIISP